MQRRAFGIDSARHRLREKKWPARSLNCAHAGADARAELAAYAAIPRVSAEDEARLRASLELLSEQEGAAAQRLSSAREAYEQARFGRPVAMRRRKLKKAPEARASRTAPIAAFCAAGLLAVAAFALALAAPDALPVAIFAMVASVCCVGVGALLIAKGETNAAFFKCRCRFGPRHHGRAQIDV